MAAKRKPPKFYLKLQKTQPTFLAAWESVGKAVRGSGPIDLKTAHLVQLAAAAAIRSEGAVHSHVRRAVEAGATPGEVRQAIMLIAATAGFPNAVAALSWAEDVLRD